MREESIRMVHGSGGSATGELIREVFESAFRNDTLSAMEDAAVLERPSGRIAVTTDSFVVDPVEYRGGDIGRLAVCGTVNDLLMRGAVPRYLTAGWILKTGTSLDLLRRVVKSMAETAKEAGVTIVAGDTKVVEESSHGEIYINTTGVGVVPDGVDIAAANAAPGDKVLLSGTLGDHHAAILSERMAINTDIVSDTAPLTAMCERLRGWKVHTMRDVTRGGLGTVLKELALASGTVIRIREKDIPVSRKVRDFCGLLGLDPVYMGNEGKMVVIVDESDAEEALRAMRESDYGADAVMIGEVSEPMSEEAGSIFLETAIGGIRELDVLQGEGLPRIC
ncbi:MAG: hydrogenase expression/formation protein HypE [Eubacterium sp.]|nr:hydrogenase expression/formation protein HypE [Eubacterium sp.]